MASKVWETMNDLEMTTVKITSAREIIDAAIDRIQEHQYDKAEVMMSAAYEFLEYYLNEFDEKFKLAWKETVVKQDQNKWTSFWDNKDPITGYTGSTVSNVNYTDEELDAMCDAAEKMHNTKKWVLPVELEPSGECFVTFPDDLLEAANLEEGDQVEWVDQGDGSYLLKKVVK